MSIHTDRIRVMVRVRVRVKVRNMVSTPGSLYSTRGSGPLGFCDANPGDPGVGVGVCLPALINNNITDTFTHGSKTVGFQWLTGYVQSDYLFL